MGMGFAPTWLRQVSSLLHMTTLTTDYKNNNACSHIYRPIRTLPLLITY